MSGVRCAVYTRKSSDEGLEQEFNSLDAQYEACRSFIASQRHEGWTLVRKRYDDGGVSGGSMDRPGLAALLADVAADKVDVIVIYKIDRLTRSLTDFARIVEQLERADASFVSVTQSFNTKTSMGRLMLHVLLSFAQFEREVGAERVRDKIAASKAKGMWMGGTVPLGFNVVDRKLVISEVEAATVRAIFDKFVELRSVQGTLRWAQREDLRTKARLRLGQSAGNRRFEYGSLRCLLANRLYVGEIQHKDAIHQGQHQAIVDRDVFDKAQSVLAGLSAKSVRGRKLASGSLLQGLIVDRHGRTMGPVHTVRRGQRFRYYVTHHRRVLAGDPEAYRLAAEPIEAICCQILSGHISAQVSHVEGVQEAKRLQAILTGPDNRLRRELLVDRVARVTVGDAKVTMELVDGAKIERALERVRHGNDARLLVGDLAGPKIDKPAVQILLLLQDARAAQELVLAKPTCDLPTLAKEFGRSTERFRRLLRLSYLAPAIVDAVAEGRQPPRFTSRFLQNLNGIPLSWPEQEELLLR